MERRKARSSLPVCPLNFWDLPHHKQPEADPSKYPSTQALDDAFGYFGFH